MKRVVTQVACYTDEATQVVPLPGLGNTPKAFQFWLVPATANNMPVDGMATGYGVAAITDGVWKQYALSVRSRHGASGQSSGRSSIVGACVYLFAPSSNNIVARAAVVDATVDSVTLQWSVQPPAAYLLLVEAIDCNRAFAGSFLIPQNEDDFITVTVGFPFRLLYVGTVHKPFSVTATQAMFSWGVARNDPDVEFSLNQASFNRNTHLDDKAPTSQTATLEISFIAATPHHLTGAIFRAIEILNPTATGFNVYTRVGNYPDDTAEAFYLALDLPALLLAQDLPDAPDNEFEADYSVVYDQVASVEAFSTLVDPSSLTDNTGRAGPFGFGMWDGERQYSIAAAERDNVSTTDTESQASVNLVRMHKHDGSTGLIVEVVDEDGGVVMLDVQAATDPIGWLIMTVVPDMVPPVTADFSATPTSGAAPLSVTFTDESVGEIDHWKWNFGDGTTSTGQNPVHVYEQAAEYTVVLTVSDETELASSTRTRPSYITVTEPAPPPPPLTGVPVLASVAVPQIMQSDVQASVETGG